MDTPNPSSAPQPTPRPAATEQPKPKADSGWTVKQYPRRMPADRSADPQHEAILIKGDEERTLTGTYDELIAEVKQITGATK